MSDAREELYETSAAIMEELLSSFQEGTKISIIIHTPEEKTLVMTNENDITDVIGYLEVMKSPEGSLH